MAQKENYIILIIYEYIYLIGKWNICMLIIFPGILDSYTYCVLMCLK